MTYVHDFITYDLCAYVMIWEHMTYVHDCITAVAQRFAPDPMVYYMPFPSPPKWSTQPMEEKVPNDAEEEEDNNEDKDMVDGSRYKF